jgi:hypothetical protein
VADLVQLADLAPDGMTSTLVPRVIGQTEAAREVKRGGPGRVRQRSAHRLAGWRAARGGAQSRLARPTTLA